MGYSLICQGCKTECNVLQEDAQFVMGQCPDPKCNNRYIACQQCLYIRDLESSQQQLAYNRDPVKYFISDHWNRKHRKAVKMQKVPDEDMEFDNNDDSFIDSNDSFIENVFGQPTADDGKRKRSDEESVASFDWSIAGESQLMDPSDIEDKLERDEREENVMIGEIEQQMFRLISMDHTSDNDDNPNDNDDERNNMANFREMGYFPTSQVDASKKGLDDCYDDLIFFDTRTDDEKRLRKNSVVKSLSQTTLYFAQQMFYGKLGGYRGLVQRSMYTNREDKYSVADEKSHW